jgi:DNA-binding transcriptional ArsR family regulator
MKQNLDVTQARVAKAMSHPLRMRVLTMLQQREASPSELAGEMGVPLSTLSYHFRQLDNLGLLELTRTVPRRGAVEHYYRATARLRPSLSTWAGVPPVVKETVVAASLSDLGSNVNAAAVNGGFSVDGAHLTAENLLLDEAGWGEVSKELTALVKKVEQIQMATRKRLDKAAGNDGHRRATIGMMLFETPVQEPDKPAKRRKGAKRKATRRA